MAKPLNEVVCSLYLLLLFKNRIVCHFFLRHLPGQSLLLIGSCVHPNLMNHPLGFCILIIPAFILTVFFCWLQPTELVTFLNRHFFKDGSVFFFLFFLFFSLSQGSPNILRWVSVHCPSDGWGTRPPTSSSSPAWWLSLPPHYRAVPAPSGPRVAPYWTAGLGG